MTTHNAPGANERAPSTSLVALALLADPVSTLLDRGCLVRIAAVALRRDQPTTRDELVLLRDCSRTLDWLSQKLKEAITAAYATGDIDAVSAQRLVDHFELWSG
jgi:hypothetical protein